MKNLFTILLALALVSTNAFASTTRSITADQIQNSALSKTFTFPSTSDTIAGQSVANGGTGASTFTSNGILFGAGTSALSATAAGTQFQVLQAGSGGTPQFAAVNLAQSAAVTGILGVANGGTGASTLTANNVILGNGTSAVQFVAPSTSGNVLTSNGTTWVSMAPSSTAPSLNGGSGAPQSVTASGGISLSSISFVNFVWVVGSPSAVTVTATPSITAGNADGQILKVIGTDATKTVTLQDNAGLAGSKLQLNGNVTLGLNSVIDLHWDNTATSWVEDARRN